MKKLKIINVGLAALFMSSSAFAIAPRFSLGPVAGWTNVDVKDTRNDKVTHENKVSWGGMLLVEVPAVDQFGFETGAIFVNRKFSIGNSTVNIERTVPTIYVPLEMRGWAGNILSAAAGGFAAFKVGNVTDKVKSGTDTLATFSSNKRDAVEYGLTAALTLNIAGVTKSGLYVEGRYMHGLSDNGSSGIYEEKIRDVLFSAGFRFGGEERSDAAPAPVALR